MPNVRKLVRDLYDAKMRRKVADGRHMKAQTALLKLLAASASPSVARAERARKAVAAVRIAKANFKKASDAEDRARAKLLDLLENEDHAGSLSNEEVKAVADYAYRNKRPSTV